MPQIVEHIWRWFWSLSAKRHSGPESISFAEIDAWALLTGETPNPNEVQMLMSMDSAWMNAMNDEIKAHRALQVEKAKTTSTGTRSKRKVK